MNKEELNKIARYISDDIIRLARDIMQSDVGTNVKVNFNTLYDSNLYRNIKGKVSWKGDEALFETFFNHYIEYIERGRPPKYGKRPPTKVIVEWLKRKRIVASNKNIEGVAFVISRAIWRDGIKARKVLTKLDEACEKAFDTEWADMLFDAVTEDIDKWFSK